MPLGSGCGALECGIGIETEDVMRHLGWVSEYIPKMNRRTDTILLSCCMLIASVACLPAGAALDGDWQTAFGFGANGPLYAATQFDGDLVVGGDFTSIGGVAANGVARWDGAAWHSLDSGVVGRVHALVQHGTKLVAGGLFTQAGSFSATNVATWNGSFWAPLGNDLDDVVYALESYNGIIAAGAFTELGGPNLRRHVARWTGADWVGLDSGVDNTALSLHASGGTLYVGGLFANAGGQPAAGIASWDGADWAPLGDGVSSSLPFGFAAVEAISEWDDGIAVAGRFDFAGTSQASNVASWDGSGWNALGNGLSGTQVPTGGFAIERFRSHLIVAGRFETAGGVAASRIAAWDGVSWSGLGQGLDADGYALQALGRHLYVGGSFATAGGTGSQRVADWLAPFAPAGAVPDGALIPGVGLTMRKLVVPGFAALDWGASCNGSDIDYAVYAGSLGDFTSHQPLTCSTGGSPTWGFANGEEAYFLVVPVSEDVEGGYGFASDGSDRSASSAACAVQARAACATP